MNPLAKSNQKKLRIPLWLVIGAILLMAPIIAVTIRQQIVDRRAASQRLLVAKGAALIRSLEAGARTGMHAMPRRFQIQRLIQETASQPDIAYIYLADLKGRIKAHSNSSLIGTQSTVPDLVGMRLNWQRTRSNKGEQIFELYRLFKPLHAPMRRHKPMRPNQLKQHKPLESPAPPPPSFFVMVGLSMEPLIAAGKNEIRHMVAASIRLAIIGIVGVLLLFLYQRYRETRSSLSQAQAFSDVVVSHMPTGLIAIDPDGTIVTANTVATEILNLTPEALNGQSTQVLPEKLQTLLNQELKSRSIYEEQLNCTLDDGSTLPLEVSLSETVGSDQSVLGKVLLIKDLSEIIALKNEVTRNQRLASIGRLAGGVAHEIRNPLSSIKGFATYFKERYQKVPEDQKIAAIMIDEINRLDRVVGQLQDFSRPVTIHKKKTDLNGLIKDAMTLVAQQTREHNIEVHLEIDPETGPVQIDADRIRQVLLNLFLNAIDAMDRGGTLTIRVELPAPKALVIHVGDTGPGISPEMITHIFDPYFTTKPSGTGLGLAIAHNIIQAHGGTLAVTSQPHEGATLTITLKNVYMNDLNPSK
jgi:two-component system sensor histidine kinase HydH